MHSYSSNDMLNFKSRSMEAPLKLWQPWPVCICYSPFECYGKACQLFLHGAGLHCPIVAHFNETYQRARPHWAFNQLFMHSWCWYCILVFTNMKLVSTVSDWHKKETSLLGCILLWFFFFFEFALVQGLFVWAPNTHVHEKWPIHFLMAVMWRPSFKSIFLLVSLHLSMSNKTSWIVFLGYQLALHAAF